MANANSNIMSISINPAAGSTGSGNSRLGYKSSQNGGSDFNAALDRANNTINRQAAPAPQNPNDAEEVSYSDAAKKNPDAPVESKEAATNTANQGQTKTQDAPQNVPQNQAAETDVPAEIDTKNVLSDEKVDSKEISAKNVPAQNVPTKNISAENISTKNIVAENILPNVEIRSEVEVSDVAEVQNVLPFMFNANTETLLPSQVTENSGEVNLMAVVPQSNKSKGQEMLNILSGKTWTAEDVQATLTAQNTKTAEFNPDALNFAQNGKNFTFNASQNTDAENVQVTLTAQNTKTAEFNPDNLNFAQNGKNFTFNASQNTDAENVQVTLTTQNTKNVEFNPDNLNFAQNGKNFTFNANQNTNVENVQPQILTRQTILYPEQPQIQNTATNLNADANVILKDNTTVNLDVNANLNVNTNLNSDNNTATNLNVNTNLNFVDNNTATNLNANANLKLNNNTVENLNVNANLNLEQSPQVQTTNLNAEETLQPTVQRQIEMQAQPILNSVNPQVEPKQNNQLNQIAEVLGGNLQVEDQNAPLSPIQPTLRQQQESNQQQSANQNLNTTSQDSTAETQTQTQNVGGEESFAQNVTPANNNVSTTQNVTQIQTPEASQAAREADIPAQIVQQARLIRNAENTEMVINLKPEHLGQLTLRVSVSQNGAVNASFYSDNAQVRAAIENSIVQLKQELNDQGLKVDNVQVSSYLNDSGLMNGQGGQAWQQQRQQQSNRRIDFETLQEEVDAVTPETETNSADGVDYKI